MFLLDCELAQVLTWTLACRAAFAPSHPLALIKCDQLFNRVLGVKSEKCATRYFFVVSRPLTCSLSPNSPSSTSIRALRWLADFVLRQKLARLIFELLFFVSSYRSRPRARAPRWRRRSSASTLYVLFRALHRLAICGAAELSATEPTALAESGQKILNAGGTSFVAPHIDSTTQNVQFSRLLFLLEPFAIGAIASAS